MDDMCCLVKLDSPQGKPTWYFVKNDTHRRIVSSESLLKYKALFGVRELPPASLGAYRRGAAAPTSPTQVFDPEIARTVSLGRFRENVGLNARGRGIEIGAGGRPLVTALDSTVTYVDRFASSAMMEFSSARHGAKHDDMVPVDVVDSIEELRSFSDDSLDFVVAAHVIEHVANPLGAIETVTARLATGGKLILIVPDCRRTHDRVRPVTTLEHVVADYFVPERSRDLEHYVERLHRINNVPLTDRDAFVSAWDTRMDVHLHTYDFASFSRMIDFAEAVLPIRLTWSHDGLLEGTKSQEMYFVLEKRELEETA